MVAAGSITVAVRVRPPTTLEAARLPQPCYDESIRGDGTLSTPGRAMATSNVREIVQIIDDRILTFDPPEVDPTRAFMERGFLPPGTKRYKDKRFMFDRVFDHDVDQEAVYAATAKPLLQPLLEGYNATIFAYGATGCGKTHTISGTDTDPGVIYLTMADLFQRIDDRRDEWNVEVIVTFLEIYNEDIRDLLADPETGTAPRGGLQIREDKSVKVVGLVEMRPKSAEEVKAIVLQGNERRTQSPTHANQTSSRSHAVLQVHVTQAPRTASVSEERTMGTLSVIDLAGSERAAATSNMGQRMVEGANINKSLLALGNCINALCESGGAVRHVPYRNSKLTRLLKFSLGGNCKTVMVVCIAPTSLHFDDTHNTLLYAERATKIKTKVVTRNVVNVERHVGRYVEAINRLNLEVAELKAKLAGKASGEADIARRKRAEAAAEVERAKKDVQTKAEQTQPAIVDGATCQGRLSAAAAKLASIQRRLRQLNLQACDAPLSADLEAERSLLQALAAPEEAVTRPDSALHTRLNRSNNSSAMFDATLKAVADRRLDRLDEVGVDNVRLETRMRKAEMERARADAREAATRDVIDAQTELLVSLLGMVGRCNVMLGDASRTLSAVTAEDAEAKAKVLASALGGVAAKNDDTFTALLGQSTAGYAVGPSALDTYKGYGAAVSARTSLAPSSAAAAAKVKPGRRASAVSVASPRRSLKSPRKSLRNSLGGAGAPYRRTNEEKAKKKKSVQWRDDVGRGNIDDGGLDPFAVPTAGPIAGPSSAGPSSAGASSDTVLPRPPSAAASVTGSESEWEDDRVEEAPSILFTRPTGVPPIRRPSRLDPGFLKGKAPANALSSLAEDDDEELTPKRPSPLADRSMNRQEPSSPTLSALRLPKGAGSPGRRLPSTASIKVRRRTSNVGPVRSEKTRRRSSMLLDEGPDVAPTALPGPVRLPARVSASAAGSQHAGPRRLDSVRSPAKRAKRVSLLGAAAARSIKARQAISGGFSLFAPSDANSSADISVSRPPSRGIWR